MSTPKDNLSGRIINEQYELLERLVHRAITDQYRARQVFTGETVLIEIFREPSVDSETRERFWQHIHSLAGVKHPHIAPILAHGETEEGRLYAVIQSVSGPTLADRLTEWQTRGTLPSSVEALRLVHALADALGVAHKAGIVHHNLRPSNIWLDDNNKPVLVDLVVPYVPLPPTPLETLRQQKMLDYASPEQRAGEMIDERSNIYSLGIILYELLAGHRPQLPISDWHIFEHRSLPREVPLEQVKPGLSRATYRLVKGCLWRQAWSRFETAEMMVKAIERAISEEETAVIQSTHPRRLTIPRWLIYGGIVLIVAGTAVASLLLLR